MRAVEDLAKRTLKELLTLARERFGSDAARLKTRDELIDALSRVPAASVASAETPVALPTPAPAPVAPEKPSEEWVVRDFFRRRS